MRAYSPDPEAAEAWTDPSHCKVVLLVVEYSAVEHRQSQKTQTIVRGSTLRLQLHTFELGTHDVGFRC